VGRDLREGKTATGTGGQKYASAIRSHGAAAILLHGGREVKMKGGGARLIPGRREAAARSTTRRDER
jgi:hypothetical protein